MHATTQGAESVQTASAPLIVGIGGTPRPNSSSELALAFALEEAERLGAKTAMFGSAAIQLPMYVPDMSNRTPEATALVKAFKEADGIIVSSPGYHGGISGLIKNALDYIEDIRDLDPPYMHGRAVGCIVSAHGWQATMTTMVSLRSVIHALRGWPTPLGVTINSAEPIFDSEGKLVDERVAENLRIMTSQVVEFARNTSSASARP